MDGTALLRPISSNSRFSGRLLFHSSARPRRFTSSSPASSRFHLRRHLRPISTIASPLHLPCSLSSSYSPIRAVSTSSSPAASDVQCQFVAAEKLGFEMISEEFLEECNSRAVLYRHKKTGAEVMSVANDDENKVFGVVLRTPP